MSSDTVHRFSFADNLLISRNLRKISPALTVESLLDALRTGNAPKDETYVVTGIMGYRNVVDSVAANPSVEVLVLWEGLPPSQASWEHP
jgi:hypothetical protein